MRDLGMDLSDSGGKFDVGRAYVLVSRFQKLHTELDNIILMRADGQVLLTGNTPNSPDLPSLAGNSSFIKFSEELQKGPPFQIGRPVIGNIDKSWVVAARLAIADRDGKLRYILSANLPTDLLQRMTEASLPPGIDAMGLIRDDGYLVNRYPEPDAASMDRMYGEPLAGAMFEFLRANGFPPKGQAKKAGLDAAIYAMRRLKHYPLTLFAEMPASEIKAARLRKVRTPYSLITLLLAGILVFYAVTSRRRRIWSMEQRREMHRRNYEQALMERSPNEIYMFDADTLQFTYANDYALDVIGYTLEEMQQKDIFSLHPELSVEEFADMIAPLRSGEEESITYRATQKRADGSSYPVEVNLQLIKSDEENDFLAIINDISALIEAEENISKFNSPEERRSSARKAREITA
jgi:PAS domain S-box-containing protein